MSTAPESRAARPSRDEVRRALLDAAAQVFARRGIDSASLDDVAAAAGFTKGAVYSNFGSKDGLVAALVDDRVTAYLDLGLGAVSDLDAPFDGRIQALGDQLTTAFDAQRDWTLLFLEMWQRAVRSGRTDSAFLQRRRELQASITTAIEHHFGAAGAALPMPAGELATLLMALSNGLAIERHADPSSVPDDLLGRVLTLIIGGTPPSE
ncbi:TetR/AcrR family transcriptional regulator [Aeromicrobium sp. CF3.5]|uniref:TetR/AcrR family transcriptional regulator n=1 Tax=Aeromicrobium sp. CF3.5 TaxID=3373078 RepID=UPI003EE46004